MAFVDPTQETPGPAVPAAQQAPVAAGGQGVGGATKAAATPGQNLPAQPSAQLSAYLAANQPQSQAFAGQVAGQVGSQVNAAGAAINPAVNTYTGSLYTVPTDAAANAALATAPASLTPDQTTSVKNELGASAAAPNPANTFEASQGYADTTTGIQNAVEQANLWGAGNDVASLSTALAPFEGASATTGDKTLDSLLLSQTPGAYGQITDAAAPAAALPGQLAAGTTAADTALQNAIAQDTAATGAANTSAQNYVTGLNSTLAQYLAQAQTQANEYNAGVGTISQELANVQPQIAGLESAVSNYNNLVGQGPNAWGTPTGQTFAPINLASYLTPSGTIIAPNINQVATPQQYNDVAALQALLGASGAAALNPSIDPSNAAQAGTWNTGNAPLNLAELLDPMFSSAIQGETPALDTLLQDAGGGGNTSIGTQVPNVLGNILQSEGLGSYSGIGGAGGSPTESANIQGGSPIGQDVSAIDAALSALSEAHGITQAPVATPPAGVAPGTAAYDAWLEQQYPGLNIPGYNPTTGTVSPTTGYGVL